MDAFTLNKIEFDAVRQVLGRYCSTFVGREMAHRIQPSRQVEVVRRWLEQTSQMVRAVRDIGLPPFGGITDIRDALQRAKPGGGAESEEYGQIASALRASGNLKMYLESLDADAFDRLHTLAGRMETFDSEVQAIRAVVGDDGKVRDDASGKLNRLRREIESTTQKLREIIYDYARHRDVAELLQSTNVTLHGDRYVLPVKAENRGRLPGVVHRASNTGATVFIEPSQSVELNNRLVDIVDEERREVRRLLNELGIRVQKRAEQMAATMRIVAAVDVVTAKAQYAYQFDMVCPEVSDDALVELGQARHPLLMEQEYQQERAGRPADEVHRVVPIDVRLGEDFDLVVITGSNTGGKTVALKTLALLAVMTQAGMHVPARRGATTRIFKDVLIDIGDEQSLEQSLSTFGGHIDRIRYILEHAGSKSLVLLDELGSGTDPDEGGAIGEAILDELRRLGCLGMVTTHLGVLKAYAYNHERVDNASVEFDTETLSPTYRLHIGTPGESHAITVARRLGLPERVTSTAQQHVSEQQKQFRRAIRRTSKARKSAEAARSEAQAAQAEAISRQEHYRERLGDIEQLQQEFETWLASLSELKAGDEVMIPSLDRPGRLVRLELHRQRALVEADGKSLEIPLTQLMPDLGQESVRKHVREFRQEIADKAETAEALRSEAEKELNEAQKLRQEAMSQLAQHQLKARQFDTWLGAVSHLKPGQEVPIARKPGKGKLLSVDLPAMKATVQAGGKKLDLTLQDLFPETGPFARDAGKKSASAKPRKGRKGKPRRGRTGGEKPQAEKETEKEAKPMRRGAPQGKKADQRRQAVLSTPPGEPVYVVPFNKRATLVRVDEEKGKAVVSSGAFEMQIPLADVAPIE